jgi:hypothetical protein
LTDANGRRSGVRRAILARQEKQQNSGPGQHQPSG